MGKRTSRCDYEPLCLHPDRLYQALKIHRLKASLLTEEIFKLKYLPLNLKKFISALLSNTLPGHCQLNQD